MAGVWPPAATDDARPSNGAREQEVGDKGVSGLDVYCSNGLQCTVQFRLSPNFLFYFFLSFLFSFISLMLIVL